MRPYIPRIRTPWPGIPGCRLFHRGKKLAWVQSEVKGQVWCQDQCVGLTLGDDGRVSVGGERCRKDGNGGSGRSSRILRVAALPAPRVRLVAGLTKTAVS